MHDDGDVVSGRLVVAVVPEAVGFTATRLTGGVSAETYRVDVSRPDGTSERLVVRHRPMATSRGWLRASDELAILRSLAEAGFPVPRPHLVWEDETLVMSWIDGTTALPDDAPIAMAEALARIHAHRDPTLDGLPEREDPRPLLERALVELGFEDVGTLLDAAGDAGGSAQGRSEGSRCLLHGDFWAGNLLWRDGVLVGVLDWEDGALGDPLSDVACARVELAVACGQTEASTFTSHYLRVTGRDASQLALWDVYVSTAALESMDSWGLEPTVLERRRAATLESRQMAVEVLRARAHDAVSSERGPASRAS